MTTVGYDIEVDGRKAETEIRKVDNALGKLKTSGDASSNSIDKLNKELARTGSGVQGADQRIRLLTSGMAAMQASFAGFTVAAAARELLRVGTAADTVNRQFDAVFKSATEAARQLGFVRTEAGRLGLDIRSAANDFALLSASTLGTNLEGAKTRAIFSAVSEASAKLGLSAATTSGTLVAFRQIASGATLQTEELNQISERIPGTFTLAGRALGVTTGEVKKLIAEGKVATSDFLPKFAAELRRSFGTDELTRIDTAAANFARLRSEIQQTTQEAAKLPTALASQSASLAANLIARGRSVQGQFASTEEQFRQKFGSGTNLAARLEAQQIQESVIRRRVAAATTGLDTDALVRPRQPLGEDPRLPKLSAVALPDGPTGFDLLSSGVRQKTVDEIARDAKARELMMEKARRDAQAAADSAMRNAEQLARSEIDRTNTVYARIRAVQDEAGELRLQLETGEKITSSARELAQLRNGDLDFLFRGREAAKALLATELERAVALERSAAASELANDAARRAADQLRSGPGAAGAAQKLARASRRGVPLSLDDIGAQMADARVFETDRFQKQVADLRGGDEATFRREGRLKENQTINDLIEQAAQEHQEELTQIEANGQLARQTLMRAQLDVAAEIFGGLANLAQVFGKRGFAIYKAAAIAEATISTIKGAKGAFERANEAYPAPFGAIAGAASAAIVTASGFAQIARIRAQQYGGGREFGGPVSDSQFYEIGERGKPEIINSDGRYYLFGAQGNVIPASNSGALQGEAVPTPPAIINVYNNGAATVRTETRRMGRQDLIDIFVDEIADNASQIGRSIASKTGVRGRGQIG